MCNRNNNSIAASERQKATLRFSRDCCTPERRFIPKGATVQQIPAYQTLQCPQCHKLFQAERSQVKARKFCSVKCKGDSQTGSVIERFLKNVKQTSTCWLWIGGKRRGYGALRIKGKQEAAHRISYRLFKGAIPENLLVLHHCDVPDCVNPGHLFLGTPLDNIRDMFSKKRDRHVKGEESGNHKLTNEQVIEICNASVPHADLALKFGVHRSTISLIKSKQHWKHLWIKPTSS